MELVRKEGQLRHFRFDQFHACEKKYQQLEQQVCWKDWPALCKFVSSLENKSAHIVAHIDSETAKKWLHWDVGKLFVVPFEGHFTFCFEGGTIVPV